MNNKFSKTLFGILAVMIFIVGFSWFNDEFLGGAEKSKTKNISLNFADLEENAVEKITIKKGENEKKFFREGGKWKIGSDEVDEKKMTEFFLALKKLKVKEMVSQNENNQGKFEVDKEGGIKLIITKSGQDQMFLIGKVGNSASEFYMRKDGIKNVYLVESGFRERLDWEETKWKKENADEAKDN